MATEASLTAFIVFYVIVAAISITGTVIAYHSHSVSVTAVGDASGAAVYGQRATFNMGASIIGMIFLLIVGLSCFTENLNVAFANGVSRRTHFAGFALFSFLASAVTALVSMAIDAIPSLSPETFQPVFHDTAAVQLLFLFAVYLFLMALGYFIAGGYYRMNKPAKAVVSICVPVLLLLLLIPGAPLNFLMAPFAGLACGRLQAL